MAKKERYLALRAFLRATPTGPSPRPPGEIPLPPELERAYRLLEEQQAILRRNALADGPHALRTAGFYTRAKSAVEPLVAALLLVLALPIMGLIAILVKITSRGPIIYRQVRMGKDKRMFIIRKFRTMIEDAERHTGPVWTRRDDPRITPLGRIMRRFHLDELPQLWNVLCGHMSFIGPRPERPEFVKVLERAIPRYHERFRVKPGITGLAQIMVHEEANLESVKFTTFFDIYYSNNIQLSIDVKIIAALPFALAGLPVPSLVQKFHLPDAKENQIAVDVTDADLKFLS